jgi:hypothetical protein
MQICAEEIALQEIAVVWGLRAPGRMIEILSALADLAGKVDVVGFVLVERNEMQTI